MQAWRLALDISFIRVFFLLVIVFIALFIAHNALQNTVYYQIGVVLLMSLIIVSIQIKRSDFHFLQIMFPHYRFLFMFEYFVISLPVYILYVRHDLYSHLAVLLGVNILVPFLVVSRSARYTNHILVRLIPSRLFEWKSGMRKNAWILTIVLLAVPFGFLHVAIIPIAYVVAFFIVTTFYNECESRLVLEQYLRKTPADFLLDKVLSALKIKAIVLLPMVLLFLVFHIEYWYIFTLMVVFGTLIFVMILLRKYAHFVENEILPSDTPSSLAMLGIFIPFLLPLGLFLIVYYYRKSLKKLALYHA